MSVVLRVFREHLRIGPPANASTRSSARSLSHDFQTTLALKGGFRTGSVKDPGHTPSKGHSVGLTGSINFDIQPRTECVDHRCAHSVQPARCRIRTTAELATCVQLRQDHLDTGEL